MTPAASPPPDLDRYFEESVEIWRLRLGVPRWLKDNPGLVLTGAYVLASLIGIAYVFTFFRRFRIDVLEYPKVTVELKAETGISSQPITATLLGTTSRFLFVYRPETRRAEAIPFDAIARLSWDARSRREREREASTTQ